MDSIVMGLALVTAICMTLALFRVIAKMEGMRIALCVFLGACTAVVTVFMLAMILKLAG